MKKHLKLLLLGWIFTFIWIFNFSSAEWLKYDLSYNGCFILDWQCECPRKTYDLSNWLPKGIYHLISPNYATISNWYVNAWYGWNMNFNWNSINIVNATNDIVPQLSITFSLSDMSKCNSSNSFTFSLVSNDYVPPIIEWWTSTFTPIITWLTNSVNEFIPYVAYVWIWLLTAIIWFVAIKRLINWVRAKIFSSFKR